MVTWKWSRSTLLKWSEEINWKKLWQHILEVLKAKQGSEVDNIVYVWEKIVEEDTSVVYAESASWKSFLKSLHSWVNTLKLIDGIKNDITLVICWDIPMVWASEVDFMLKNIPTWEQYLSIFWVNNKRLQNEYPDFNKDKRYLELREQDIIFWNAFLIRRRNLEEWLNKILCLDENWLKIWKVIKFLFKLWPKNFYKAILFLLFSNIKALEKILPWFLKKIKKPWEKDLVEFIEDSVWKKWVKLINNSPSELVIDYDRQYQLPFFEREINKRK